MGSMFNRIKIMDYSVCSSYTQVMYVLPFGLEIDMWSLGCILGELYIGMPIFMGEDKKQMLSKVRGMGIVATLFVLFI